MTNSVTPWTQADAIALCVALEAISPKYGAHVALTGGLLYKDGPRKDADILLYRIRQIDAIDIGGMMAAFEKVDVSPVHDYGWCYKATFQGKPIDFFFPEREGGGDYPPRMAAPSLEDDEPLF